MRSICVEGWITSTQFIRMIDMVEEVERKASSHNLQGELLLICDASFLLTGLVAIICSPETFYKMLSKEVKDKRLLDIKPQFGLNDEVADILDTINVFLIKSICKKFDDAYKETIKRNLYFIAIAAHAFINMEDQKLMRLVKIQGIGSSSQHFSSRNLDETIKTIKQSASLPRRVEDVKKQLRRLKSI